jgi:hypothetical protein
MQLKNYTSSVAANTTISYIETYLTECGVSGITKEFKNGTPIAVVFYVDVEGRRFSIRLPANVEQVQDFLWKEYVTSRTRPRPTVTRESFREQAARTAWKIQQDWVQVQMSLIKLKQADFLQVFMAFVWDGQQTFYEQVRGNQFKALPESV